MSLKNLSLGWKRIGCSLEIFVSGTKHFLQPGGTWPPHPSSWRLLERSSLST